MCQLFPLREQERTGGDGERKGGEGGKIEREGIRVGGRGKGRERRKAEAFHRRAV